MHDTGAGGDPNHPPVVPIPTRYAAAETLDRLRWLPPDLDTFVETPTPQSPIYVARYPVTNQQFSRFMDAGGYEDERWWTEAIADGRWADGQIRDWQGRRGRPRYWDHPRYGKNRRGYPVVGVSWYEANAYCRWLTEQLRAPRDTQHVSHCTFYAWRDGEPEALDLQPETLTARLPTDQEWTAAAGGEAGDRYPWGPEWHESCANTGEGGISGTTPVGMYPSGQSPLGVWDMAGNVWEWLASQGEECPLRGGSWGYNQRLARVSARNGHYPDLSYHNMGFRVVVFPAGADF